MSNIDDIVKSITDDSGDDFDYVLSVIEGHESSGTPVPIYIVPARKGDREKQFILGEIYNSGAPLDGDRYPQIAYMFFELSAKKGHKKAAEEMVKLEKEMSPEYKERAKNLSLEWDKKYPPQN